MLSPKPKICDSHLGGGEFNSLTLDGWSHKDRKFAHKQSWVSCRSGKTTRARWCTTWSGLPLRVGAGEARAEIFD